MKRIFFNTVSAITALIFLVLAFPIMSYCKTENNIYAGISVGSYDEALAKKFSVMNNGAVDISEKGGTLVYKNVDFYKNVSHIQVTYSTGTFVNERKIKITADSLDSEIILANATLEETGSVENYTTATFEVTASINGKHDIYLTDISGSSARIKSFKCLGRKTEQESQDAVYPDEIYILNALGIADFSYVNKDMKSLPVTRRDFSVIGAALFNIKDVSNIDFHDVEENDKDKKAMSAMYALGNLKAPDGFFYPEKNITLEEACKAYLTIMGYETKVNSLYGGRFYPQAVSLKMTDGILSSADENITYLDFIKLTENTLYVSLPETEYPKLNVIYKTNSERTVLQMIHDTYEDRGVVNGTPESYLTRKELTTSDIQVLIGNKLYNTGKCSVNEFLGYNIDFYYKQINSQNTLLCVLPIENYNEIKTVYADEVKYFSDGKLTYEINDKKKTLSFDNTADVLYNGVCCTDYTNDDFIISEGFIKFIDNNSDGNYEVISIISGNDYVIDTVDAVNETVFVKKLSADNCEPLSVLTSNDAVRNCEIYLNGYIAGIEDLKSGNVITLYDSKLYNGIIMNRKIDASDTVVHSVIKEVIQKDGKTYYGTEDNNEYEKSKHCDQNIILETEYILHLSVGGKAAWFEKGSKRDYKYGYVMKMGIKGDGFSRSLTFKILTEESEIKYFETASKLECDGEMINGIDSQYAYILGTNDSFVPQVIRYKLNSDGEIRFIDTATLGPKENKTESLVKNMKYNTADYKSTTGYFWQTTPIDDNTVVFVTPLYYTTAAEMIDKADDGDFYATKARQFGGVSGYSEGYDGTYCNPLGAMIAYKINRNEFQETSPVIYITKVSQTVDRKGNPTKKITGISKGQIVKLVLCEEANETYHSKMAEGDLWLYNLDLKNEVSYLEPLWSTDGTDYESIYPLHTTSLSKNNLYIFYADAITDRYENFVAVDVRGSQCGFSFENATVMLYDKTTGKINSISPDSIATSEQVAQSGKNQYAFIYAYEKTVTQVIIVQE